MAVGRGGGLTPFPSIQFLNVCLCHIFCKTQSQYTHLEQLLQSSSDTVLKRTTEKNVTQQVIPVNRVVRNTLLATLDKTYVTHIVLQRLEFNNVAMS